MSVLGRPIQNPQPAPKVFIRTYHNKKTGVKCVWYYDYIKYPCGLYKTEYEYPKEHISFEDENNALPKTQRKYLTEKGKWVGFSRAKQLGLVD